MFETMRKFSKAILEPSDTSKKVKILEKKKLLKIKYLEKNGKISFWKKMQNSQVLVKFFVASDFVIK